MRFRLSDHSSHVRDDPASIREQDDVANDERRVDSTLVGPNEMHAPLAHKDIGYADIGCAPHPAR